MSTDIVVSHRIHYKYLASAFNDMPAYEVEEFVRGLRAQLDEPVLAAFEACFKAAREDVSK